jgi:hypothetical protein
VIDRDDPTAAQDEGRLREPPSQPEQRIDRATRTVQARHIHRMPELRGHLDHFDALDLSAEQVERLNNLTPATGERHEEANMAAIDR